MTKSQDPRDLKPIGLTVYDLPSPEASSLEAASRTRKGRLWFFFLVMICAAPVVLSYLTYYVIRPEVKTNHGALIEPQLPLPTWSVTDLKGQTLPISQFKGQWLMLVVASGSCNEQCERLLYVQRQVHKLMNKANDRIDKVWFVTDQTVPAEPLIKAIDGATIVRVNREQLAQWLYPSSTTTLEDHIYLIDPMGNWMMRFAYPKDASMVVDMKRDLERLMRASSSWDKAGR